jgi:hypothetical protein
MYFTPDGKSAIVVAEARHRLDFRDPKTMAVQYSIDTPQCGGINHADFSNDGRYAMFTCEFDGTIAKIDLVGRKVDGYLKLQMPAKRFAESGPVGGPANEICSVKKGMPQDTHLAGRQEILYRRHGRRRRAHRRWRHPEGNRLHPDGRGAHGLYRAATARSCTWPTAARTASTASRRARAASA